jgi:hypothetical protein
VAEPFDQGLILPGKPIFTVIDHDKIVAGALVFKEVNSHVWASLWWSYRVVGFYNCSENGVFCISAKQP